MLPSYTINDWPCDYIHDHSNMFRLIWQNVTDVTLTNYENEI